MTSKLFLVFEHKRYPVDSMMDLQTMSTSSVRLCLKCDIFIVKINHILISITIYLDLLNSLDSFLGIRFRFITRWHVIHILQIFCQTFIISMHFFSYLWLWNEYQFSPKLLWMKFKTTNLSFSPYWTYDNCSQYAETDPNYSRKGTYSNACTKVF